MRRFAVEAQFRSSASDLREHGANAEGASGLAQNRSLSKVFDTVVRPWLAVERVHLAKCRRRPATDRCIDHRGELGQRKVGHAAATLVFDFAVRRAWAPDLARMHMCFTQPSLI